MLWPKVEWMLLRTIDYWICGVPLSTTLWLRLLFVLLRVLMLGLFDWDFSFFNYFCCYLTLGCISLNLFYYYLNPSFSFIFYYRQSYFAFLNIYFSIAFPSSSDFLTFYFSILFSIVILMSDFELFPFSES